MTHFFLLENKVKIKFDIYKIITIWYNNYNEKVELLKKFYELIISYVKEYFNPILKIFQENFKVFYDFNE